MYLTRNPLVLFLLDLAISQVSLPSAARPQPVTCEIREVLCRTEFCFDQTCRGASFPSARGGRCQCQMGYFRNNSLGCICLEQCLYGPSATCRDNPSLLRQDANRQLQQTPHNNHQRAKSQDDLDKEFTYRPGSVQSVPTVRPLQQSSQVHQYTNSLQRAVQPVPTARNLPPQQLNQVQQDNTSLNNNRLQLQPPIEPMATLDPFGPCGHNEVRCTRNFCFDRTCSGLSIPALSNGECRCRTGYYRDSTRRYCICLNQCLRGLHTTCPKEFVETPVQQPPTVTLSPTYLPINPPAAPGQYGYQNRPQLPPPVQPQEPSIPRYESDSCTVDLGPESQLYRLYNLDRRDHLYTTDRNEVERAINTDNFRFEGRVARLPRDRTVFGTGCPLLTELFRLYKSGPEDDHILTTKESEISRASALGYRSENWIGYCVPGQPDCGADVPLHRFWNNAFKDHIYTGDAREIQYLQSHPDWLDEGVECYIWA